MLRCKGIAAGGGIVLGRAHLLDRRRLKVPQRHLAEGEAEPEVERFLEAVSATDRQLERLKEKLESLNQGTLILEAHRLIVGDPQLIERTIRCIRSEGRNAEWALQEANRQIRRVFDEFRVSDPGEPQYFHERRTDVDCGVRHLLTTLMEDSPTHEVAEQGSVVVAHDLSPVDVARLRRDGAAAIVMEVGGKTSHTVIMARSLGMSAVIGAEGVTSRVGSGDEVIVDGDRGDLIICPDEETRNEREHERERRAVAIQRKRQASAAPLLSQDGVRVRVLANVGLTEEIPAALARGVEGIGLCRTEFLYLDRETLPSEEEHLAHTQRVLMAAGDRPVTFRTCDLEPGKLPLGRERGREANPAMGLRALRLIASHPELLQAQLRGLFRGAAGRPVRVMFPLVAGVSEWRLARDTALRVADELPDPPARIDLGVLIELPSAALQARQFVSEVDFLAVGTNDLIQYVLGVDRGDERVSHLYRPLHPAILGLLESVVRVAADAEVSLSVCGEMAGDPLCTLPLLGMGVRQFSMGLAAVALIKEIIANAQVEQAEQLFERLRRCATVEETEDEARQALSRLGDDRKSGGLVAIPSIVAGRRAS